MEVPFPSAAGSTGSDGLPLQSPPQSSLMSSSPGPLTMTIFNPALLRKEDLIRGFVARKDLLQRLLDDLRRVGEGTQGQHQLVIGQRGLGKTTLLIRLAFAIEDDPDLSSRWIPLVFPEEQYNVKDLEDFWLNCSDALSDALERMGETAAFAQLDEEVKHAPIGADGALRVLLAASERVGRGLVLLVDNVDIVLDRVSKEEEWTFRRIISNEPRLYFIGASSRAAEAFYEYGRAFFDFFEVQDLRGLDDKDTFALIDALARETGDEQVQTLVRRNPGRVRTLRVLTGGNPRTLALLYRLLAEGPDGDVQRDVEQLLDTYTPLYKARFEELAAQAQQIVDAMAIHWDPITAGELADKLAPLSVSQVSSQLKRLEDFGVVEKTPWFGEKKTAYQIGERFFNVWYLMRASRRVRRRLVWLVKFLEAWFECGEIVERAREYLSRDPKSEGRERYAEMALAYSQMVDDRHLARSLESAGLQAALDTSIRELIDFSDLPPELLDRKGRMERMRELRTRVLAMSFEDLKADEFWRVLGGSPHLSPEEKVRIVQELPSLKPAALRELFGKLKMDEDRMIAAYPNRRIEITRIYEALANGELKDPYDTEGALSLANRWNLPWLAVAAVVARCDRSCWPEDLSEIEIDKAEAALRILSAEPGHEARAWAELGSLFAFRRSNTLRAEQAFRRATEIDLQDASAWYNLGFALGNLKRHEEAEQAFCRATEINPQNASAWYNLGIALRNLKRYEEAEQAFRRATEINPQYALAWHNLGFALGSLKRDEEAEQGFRRATEIDPQDASAWHNLGFALGNLQRYEEAEQAYHRATELDPQYASAWSNLGLALGNLKRYEEAEQAGRRATEIDPQYASAWHNLGFALGNLQRYEEAEQAYRQATEIDPQYASAWYNLGISLGKLKRHEEAEQAHRRATETDPQHASAWYNLGNALDNLERHEEAEQAYRRATEIDPQDASAWNSLGIALGNLERYEEAEQAYRRAIEIDPRDWYPWANLAIQLINQGGREQEAFDAASHWIELDEDHWETAVEVLLPAARALGRGPHLSQLLAVLSRAHEHIPDDPRVEFVLVGLLTLDGKWSEARTLLHSLSLKEISDPDVWTFRILVEAGHTAETIGILEQTGANERWRPLYEALRAIAADSPEYLRRVAPEVRSVALDILAEIAPNLVNKKGIPDGRVSPPRQRNRSSGN